VAQRSALSAAALQAHPEELPHPRRQIEVGHPAGHVNQFQAEERDHVADDDPDQEDLGRDAQGRARGNLGGEDGGDPMAVLIEHATVLGDVPQSHAGTQAIHASAMSRR
jgi:hypothetical protein